MSCFIIAEAGVNHNGSVELALKLVDAAASAGADAVKFQTFRAADLASKATPTAEYQRMNTGIEDQFSMLRGLELPYEAYLRLWDRCIIRGVEFMSTPFDIESAKMLVSLGMRRIKIASGELTNLPYLERLGTLKCPIILSTGMATIDEVEEAVAAIQIGSCEAGVTDAEGMLTLLQCTSNYPTKAGDVNLSARVSLREKFGLPVGYSDHTEGTTIVIGAIVLGAVVIEKHFTLDRSLPGPDHIASLEPSELTRMVRDIRTVESAIGTGVKEPTAEELSVRDVVRRSVTVTKDLKAGELIASGDLCLKRPGTGIAPRNMHAVSGRRAGRNLKAGTTLNWDDLLQ